MTILVSILLFLFTILPADGSPVDSAKPPLPLYGKLQYAGNLGLASVGIGKYFFNHKITLDVNYGYLPESINGAEVHTFALKPAFQLWESKKGRFKPGLYTGVSMNYSITNNTYLKYPDRFPKGYYQSNALHINPLIGARMSLHGKIGGESALSLFTELGTIDYKIWYALTNKEISMKDILNICFGLTVPLSSLK